MGFVAGQRRPADHEFNHFANRRLNRVKDLRGGEVDRPR